MWTAVELWITLLILPLTWPCERIEQEAEMFRAMGPYEARHGDSSRLLFRWSALKTERYRGSGTRMCKSGQAATKIFTKGSYHVFSSTCSLGWN